MARCTRCTFRPVEQRVCNPLFRFGNRRRAYLGLWPHADERQSGDEKTVRLGYSIKRLDSTQVHGIDFTRSTSVENSHKHVDGKPVRKTPRVFSFIRKAFNGERAEESLNYQPDSKTY